MPASGALVVIIITCVVVVLFYHTNEGSEFVRLGVPSFWRFSTTVEPQREGEVISLLR